jgi:hypothetical protein
MIAVFFNVFSIDFLDQYSLVPPILIQEIAHNQFHLGDINITVNTKINPETTIITFNKVAIIK